MNPNSDNVLGWLRKLLEASTAGLERDSRAMSQHTTEVQKASQAQQAGAAALRLYDQELRVLTPQVRTLNTGLGHSQNQSQLAVVPMQQMHETLRALSPEISTVTLQTEQHANAAQRAALALQSQTVAGAALLGQGLVGLIAGRKAQAGVEAVWETARGIALLAEGTWPPNPAAIVAAGLHFEAAAQYALLAGTASHRRSAGGTGAGAPGGAYLGGVSPYGPPAQTLAPGAAGTSPQFGNGVVIIRGTQAFEEYVAGAVNGAVARGVTVTATQSQRGAPVGH